MVRSGAPIRYAVVGLGHIAQAAVLPAFEHARNSKLAALVSDDPDKRKELGRRYNVRETFAYDEYDRLLESGLIDAVYIALPNHMHCEYSVRAAEAGVHVLCEKPMAVTEDECEKMIAIAESSDVRLMIAYRLHFEKATLKAIEMVKAGMIGEPRLFSSTFTMQVKAGDIRVRNEMGGGSVYDIGVYCINAARAFFQDEPVDVEAVSVSGNDPRFREVDETTSAILRFPGDRLATFTCSFGAASVSSYRIVGTEGDLRIEPGYSYSDKLVHHLTIRGDTQRETFPPRDQFAPELIYFSRCVQRGEPPEPSGQEGLADVRVIRAIYASSDERRPIGLEPLEKQVRPTMQQEIERPAVEQPPLVNAESPTR